MKSKSKKVTSGIVSGAMLTSILVTATPYNLVYAENHMVGREAIEDEILKEISSQIKDGDKFEGKTKAIKNEEIEEQANPEEVVRVIVELKGKSVSEKIGDAKNATKAEVNSVIESQSGVKKQIENITKNEVKNSYGNVINGFSIDAKRKDIDKIEDLKGVKKVTEAKVYYPTMTTAKDLTQNYDVWKNYKYKGEGLVVSIIDTGIDYTHKDMKSPENKSKLKITNNGLNGPGKYYTEKIPYGYNFADKNDEIIDASGSMHGMHVAGIVAADGDEKDVKNNEAIQGAAPEAQLLAMKVFSNNPKIKGAYSDDIVAAIEKSVELKADVINMSLGSVAGFVDGNAPEQKAIKKATDAGVLCVVSAGNSATSTAPYINKNQKDVSTVGAPGLADDALEVASYENTITSLSSFTMIDKESSQVGFTQAGIDPKDVFKADEELEFVDCGVGKDSDFENKDVKGKVALINRGEINFVDKQINAQKAGAKVVIVYNNKDGYINMQTDDSIKIPVLFISKADGERLKQSGSKIKFEGKNVKIGNINSGKLSDFTSWGPTPDLQFAPEITAPGGNIYSTLNNNRYGSMSGTSMAAPNTSGVSALVLEGIKERGIDLSGRDLIKFIKNDLINTSQILFDNENSGGALPYSPRRQGAGMVQAENAIKNNVLALAKDGQATISLKEVGNSTEFYITLKNYGNKDETYSLSTPGGVLTSYEPSDKSENAMNHDVQLEGAKVDFDSNKVTVGANSEVKVKATLTIPSSAKRNNYAEGYIKFTNENADGVSLVIPYMGFYGDWSEEKIMSPMLWDDESKDYLVSSFAVTSSEGKYNYAGYVGRDSANNVKLDPNKIAISPNNDSNSDSIIPNLYLLRNAKEISVDILDKDKKVIARNVNKDTYLNKKVLGEKKGNEASISNNLMWDGTVYSPSKGKQEPVTEGQYYVRLNSKIDFENAKIQETLIPVKVDVTAPKISVTSDRISDKLDYELKYTIDENNSGINTTLVYVNGEKLKASSSDGKNYTLNVKLKDNENNIIQIAAADNASNLGSVDFSVSTKKSVEPKLTFDNLVSGSKTNNKDLVITGIANEGVGKLKIQGEDVKVESDGKFKVTVTLNEGLNYIQVYAEDVNGKVIISSAEKIYCDTIKPEIVLENLVPSKDGVITIPSDKLVLKGSVSDNTMGYKFSINGEVLLNSSIDGEYGADVTRKEFNKELTVNDNDIVTLKAIDLFDNETINQYKVKINPMLGVTVTGVENNGLYNKDVLPNVQYNADTNNFSATLNGKPYVLGTPITEDGDYELEVITQLKNGNSDKVTQLIKFKVDKLAPKVSVDGVENDKAYNKAVFPVLKFEEGATLLSATLDGKDYDFTAVDAEGNHKLAVKVKDQAGNITDYEMNFTIDKTSPQVTIKGVEDGKKYLESVKPEISTDGDEVYATLNGEKYDWKSIDKSGNYELVVVIKDKAGNETKKNIKFTVSNPVPANMIDNPTPTPTPTNSEESHGIKTKPTNDENNVLKDNESLTKNSSDSTSKSGADKSKSIGILPKTGHQNSAVIGAFITLIGAITLCWEKILDKFRKKK